MATATVGINTSQMEGVFDAVGFAPADAIPNALILSLSTVSKPIEGDASALKVPYVATPPAAQIVAEGEEIDEGGAKPAVLKVYTRKVAVIERITNETTAETEVQNMLAASMQRAITDKADAVFLQNKPDAGDTAPTGLFETTGAVDGGIITNALDPIVTALGTVAANGASPTAIVMNHATWATLLLLKFADGRPMIAPSVADAPAPVLYGVPVVLNKMAPANKIAIIDKADIISAVGAVAMKGSEQRYFEQDSYAIRGTFRSGWGVIHPNRLAIITVNTTATDDTNTTE
jgi:HK97 family phage major capsid protein